MITLKEQERNVYIRELLAKAVKENPVSPVIMEDKESLTGIRRAQFAVLLRWLEDEGYLR